MVNEGKKAAWLTGGGRGELERENNKHSRSLIEFSYRSQYWFNPPTRFHAKNILFFVGYSVVGGGGRQSATTTATTKLPLLTKFHKQTT